MRVHFVMESSSRNPVSVVNGDTGKNYSHIIPILSLTLVPAFQRNTLGSSIEPNSLMESLLVAEAAAILTEGALVDPVDIELCRKLNSDLPAWSPGSPSINVDSTYDLYSLQSACCSFRMYEDYKNSATQTVTNIYIAMDEGTY